MLCGSYIFAIVECFKSSALITVKELATEGLLECDRRKRDNGGRCSISSLSAAEDAEVGDPSCITNVGGNCERYFFVL